MPFEKIIWDGVGVIANCDALADSAGGSWAELGGGGISANTDNFLFPPASIGHVYASKSGFGYYTCPATYDLTPVSGAQEGQFFYIWIQILSASAFATLANNGFSIVIGTDTSNYRTYKIAGSGIGEGKPFDGGGWKLFVVDPTIAGSIADVGTFNLATINMIGLWIDTIVSVRADTIFIDQVALAKGLRVTGVGDIDEIIDYCTDYANRAWGVFQRRGTIGFSFGGLTAGDTVSATVDTLLTDSGNTVEFGSSEFWDGTSWSLTHPADYNKIKLEKHASFLTDYTSLNTAILGTVGSEISVIAETGTTMSLTGGSFRDMTQLTTLPGQVIKSRVLTNIAASSISNTPVGCTWIAPGLITIETGGSLDSCIINDSTATAAILTADLGSISGGNINSSGVGHAVELTSIGSGSMSWEPVTTGYDAGVTGSPVTPTVTGNEDIFVNVATGTLTINVAAGATVPSIRSAGAVVNVVAGLVTLAISTQDGNEVRIRQGSYTLDNGYIASVTGGEFNYAYTFAADTKITISVGRSGLVRKTEDYTLLNADTTLLFTLDPSDSYI